MRHWIRPFIVAFSTLFLFLFLFLVFVMCLIVTPLGGKWLVAYFRQEFASVGLLSIGHYEGSLSQGFLLKDLRITGLSYLPDALVRIQEIRVHLPLWNPAQYTVHIFNGRFFIPDSDPIIFTGDIHGGKIMGSVSARSVDLHAASRFWTVEDIRKNLKGSIANVDLAIGGVLFNPRISGRFMADAIEYQSIRVTHGSAGLDLMFKPVGRAVDVRGMLTVNAAEVDVRQKPLSLSFAEILFKGNFFNPLVDIRLGAKVEDMDIHLRIKGNLDNAQLLVTSDPPMPSSKALQVLFTGNALVSATSPFNAVTSDQLAEDFFKYSLRRQADQEAFGLKTKLMENLKLGLEMDQGRSSLGDTSAYYSSKINGEMDLDDHMSLNVARQVLKDSSQTTSTQQSSGAETEIYWQYKKRF